MQKLLRTILVMILAGVLTRGAEVVIEAPIVSLGLFKNGLVVVTRAFSVSEPGEYRLDAVLEPVHGTFWIESTATVQTRVTGREVEVPARAISEGLFAEELAGREVVLYLQGEGVPPVSGRIASPVSEAAAVSWDRAYEQPAGGYYSSSRWQRNLPPAGASQPYLAVDTEAGRTYVNTASIAKLEVRGAVQTVRQRRPVLVFTVQDVKTKPAMVTVSYLSKGLGWAPSYRVDLTDPARLVLRQNAVIRNELTAITAAEVFLISGYPSVEFAHVSSPLALQTTWAGFFSQLSQRPSAGRGGAAVMTQQAVLYNSVSPAADADLGATPAGEGVDLHYQPVGRLNLAEGEALALDVAQAEAPYERLVEWLVPDTRDADGRHIQEHQRDQDPERYEDAAWDSVRFKNPLSFPLTTAPAMIMAANRFNGQRLSGWTNVGEQTTLHITKALSVRTRHTEQEEPAARDIVFVGSREHRLVKVKGELLANNHRNEAITLVIRRRFSGDLLEGSGNPQSTLLEEGVDAVNRRQELLWTLTLGPGEEQKLTYSYHVLVPN
jgi:hypothetical protein